MNKLLLLVMVAVMLGGCNSPIPVTSEQFESAKRTCEPNGGLKVIYPTQILKFNWLDKYNRVLCSNGAVFKMYEVKQTMGGN